MQALITQAKSGKRSAFDKLVAEHRERLEALIALTHIRKRRPLPLGECVQRESVATPRTSWHHLDTMYVRGDETMASSDSESPSPRTWDRSTLPDGGVKSVTKESAHGDGQYIPSHRQS